MRPQLIVLSGPSGSGKSTYAAQLLADEPRATVLCSDEYHHCYLPGQDVTLFLVELALVYLRHGITVIVDAVNLHPGDEHRWGEAWRRSGCWVYRWLPMQTPVEECIARDALRPQPVGADVIHAQITGI